MRASVRKNLILTLTSAIIAIICAFTCINIACAKADTPDTFVEPAEVTVATKDAGFSVTNGASVRIETAGIKFQTIVTEDYYNSIVSEGSTIEFFAVAKKVGGTAYKVRFAQQPDFTDSTSFELNTYLNFNEYQTANKDNASALDTAYTTKFAIDTYAAVTKSGATTYYKAYQNAGNTRTMREVAAAAYANKVEGYEGLSQYFTKVITSENVADLLNATTGYYILGEDINMATAYDGVWTSNQNFSGTIDGAGHTISNLKTSTGLFKTFIGTLKNIAIIDTMTESTAAADHVGALADQAMGATVIDNVISTLKSSKVADTAYGGSSPLFGDFNVKVEGVTISNSFLHNKANRATIAGKVRNSAVITLNLQNTVLLGGNPIGWDYCPSGLHSNGWVDHFTGTYVKCANANELATAYLDGQINGLSNFVLNTIAEVCNITLINSSNVSTLLTATSGTFVLTEDIDMSTAYTDNGGVWASTKNFNGIIDGNGHTISNLKTSTGLFNTFAGTLKNIAIIDTMTESTASGDHVGALADQAGGATVIDNVILTLKSSSLATDAWGGSSPLFGDIMTKVEDVTISNSFLHNKENRATIAGKVRNGALITMNLQNTVLLGGNPIGWDYCPANVHSNGWVDHFTGKYVKCANANELETAYLGGQITGLSSFVLNAIAEVDGIDIEVPTTPETVGEVSDYSIVIANGATYQYVNAANDLKSFFTNRQA